MSGSEPEVGISDFPGLAKVGIRTLRARAVARGRMDRGDMVAAVGSVFEGYLIKARLGAGGMGVVYLARHPRLKRDVALKILHEQWALQAGTRAAFDREAALVSRLDHPNIVQVYDRSDPGSEELWLSMRHVGVPVVIARNTTHMAGPAAMAL